MSKYETVIGIEVHAQLNTKTKLFGSSSTQFGDAPNTNVDPVCLGLPGALPVLNKDTVRMAVMAGLALNCKIRLESVFSRKNYFYPDLPKGYQISQFDKPICEDGYLDIVVNGETKRIGITRIHMEEDAGKLVHQGADSIAGATHSHVDLNRAGTPLIEIVSEPDIRTADEAKAYMEALREIVQHIGVCDGNMDQGSMRADANVSIRLKGAKEFGTRTECKNLNSFRSLGRAINVERARQEVVIEGGGEVIQETRNYDDATQKTSSLRSKADAHDYRYFPEPDLPPLVLSQQYVDDIKAAMPELPKVKIERYKAEFGLSDFDCKVMIGDVAIDSYFRDCIENKNSCTEKDLCKWIVGDFNALLKESDDDFESTKVTPKQLVSLVTLINKGTISGKMAKELLEKMVKTGDDPQKLVDASGGGQISDEGELKSIVLGILKENMDVVEKIKAGKTNSANFLMGQVMKATKGKAKPDLVIGMILETVKSEF
jgi:aspartyl-tRNA(Asn)/glutamyl-tRNA(Gln) amidotransferase subunit B